MSKVIVVTGGCGGLGFEIVRSHASTGDTVYVYDRQVTPSMKELSAANENVRYTFCDAASYESVSQAFETLRRNEKRVDILYHTVGVFSFADKVLLPDTDTEIMADMYNINAVGFLRVAKAMWDLFSDTAVICVTSEAGSIGANWRSREYEYCMSKAAENMAAQILQHHFDELGNGTRIMCLHPGWVRTAMGGEEAKANPHLSVSPEDSAAALRQIAENIFTFPEEIRYMDYQQNPLVW